MRRICGGSTIQGFILRCWHSSHQVSHLNNSRYPAFVSVLGDLAHHGNVRGQGDQHVKGTKEKKKKGFRERCRFLSEVLSLSVPHFWMQSHRDCTLMRIMEMCKKKQHKIYLALLFLVLSYQSASPSKSVKYQIRAVQQLPKVSRIEALVLMFGDLWAAARAVSLCKTCDTVTGGHCQAGLSQRCFVFWRQKLTNSEWAHIFAGEWETRCRLVSQELTAAEIWRDRDTFSLKRRGKEGCMALQIKMAAEVREYKV